MIAFGSRCFWHFDSMPRSGLVQPTARADALLADAVADRISRFQEASSATDAGDSWSTANERTDDGVPVWQIVNIWEASDPFRRLTQSQKIIEEMAQLTGATELRVWHDQIQHKPAEIGGTHPLAPGCASMADHKANDRS